MIILIHIKNATINIIIIAHYNKEVIRIFNRNKYEEFHEKIIKSYFNIWYIKFFYLLLDIHNISILINIFINLCKNSGIDCNKKNKNKIYDLYNNIIHSNK